MSETPEVKEKLLYEMQSYQRNKNTKIIKGRLYLNYYTNLKTVDNDNGTVEFYYATDMNDQPLFVIRSISHYKLNNDMEIEDCNVYAMVIDANVLKALMKIFDKKIDVPITGKCGSNIENSEKKDSQK